MSAASVLKTGDATTGQREMRIRLRMLEFSPLAAALLLAAVWFGVPGELRLAMARDGVWQASPAGLTFTEASQERGRSTGQQNGAPAATRRGRIAEGYYEASRALRWQSGSPDRDFPVAARKVANALAPRTEAFYGPDGSAKPSALAPNDPAYAPLRAWASSWEATPYAFLLPDPPKPSVVASAVARPEWLISPAELASLRAKDTPDYLWKLRHRGSHPTFSEMANWTEEKFVRGEPRLVSLHVREIAGDYWLFVAMSPGGVWSEDAEGGYWADTIPFDARAASSATSGTPPANTGFQSVITTLARAYRANLWVLGPLALRAVPQVFPEGVTAEQAAEFGDAVLRTSAAPAGGEVLDYRLGRTPRSDEADALGAKYQVLAQAVGVSSSVSESSRPQTMLFVATWAANPYPPLSVGPLASAWDQLRAWFAASQNALLAVCFVLLGMTLVASPVGFYMDHKMTERERVAAEMERVQRDAHDRVYNRMAALSMRLEAESSSAADPEAAAALAAVAADLADTRRDLREILGDARSAAAEDAAKAADPTALVTSQLAALVAAQQSMTGVSMDFHADTELPPLAPEAGWDLQCIAEEAVANAVRHGRATEVAVSLSKEPGGARLEVADNGGAATPIDIESLPTSSTGLRGMQARAERLGGSLEVTSGETGVAVVVHVPERQGGRAR